MMYLAAKRMSQVVTHMGIGFALAATMSGSVLLGGLAVIIEPVINVIVLPFHERAWEAKVHKAATSRARYLLLAAEKASQTALHAVIAFGVMWAATGSMALGGLAAVVEPVCNVIVLPLHDRLWDKARLRFQATGGKTAMPALAS
jgi:uncharacterized membrane protein